MRLDKMKKTLYGIPLFLPILFRELGIFVITLLWVIWLGGVAGYIKDNRIANQNRHHRSG